MHVITRDAWLEQTHDVRGSNRQDGAYFLLPYSTDYAIGVEGAAPRKVGVRANVRRSFVMELTACKEQRGAIFDDQHALSNCNPTTCNHIRDSADRKSVEVDDVRASSDGIEHVCVDLVAKLGRQAQQ